MDRANHSLRPARLVGLQENHVREEGHLTCPNNRAPTQSSRCCLGQSNGASSATNERDWRGARGFVWQDIGWRSGEQLLLTHATPTNQRKLLGEKRHTAFAPDSCTPGWLQRQQGTCNTIAVMTSLVTERKDKKKASIRKTKTPLLKTSKLRRRRKQPCRRSRTIRLWRLASPASSECR